MNPRERLIVSAILFIVGAINIVDIFSDMTEGVSWWHVAIEGLLAALSFSGVYYLLHDTFKMKKTLKNDKELIQKLKNESSQWKQQSVQYLEGLSKSINNQLVSWGLTPSEKEVAFLLIKGFSLKEIAEFRKTAEKTARSQATSVYSKAGLSGRSQLSAFFLEDLLVPQNNYEKSSSQNLSGDPLTFA